MKRKLKNKLKQLEKSFSELAKDVAELKAKDLDSIIPRKNADVKLEVGKWYFGTTVKILFCFNGRYGNYTNYGFTGTGIWTETLGVHKSENYIEATPLEVEQALITEAKKRGFRDGINCYWRDNGITHKNLNGEIHFEEELNTLLIGHKSIFYKGIWATIFEETPIKEEEVIDFSKIQLLILKGKRKIVLTNGNYTIDTFEGSTIVLDNNTPPKELFSKIWAKELFEKFKGTLTINQE